MFKLFGLFCAFLIVAIPIFMQRTTYQNIDERKFRLYKIKIIGFLFKGMQGESASTHGVILPMLIIQIQGYLLGISSFLLVAVSDTLDFDAVLVVIITLLAHLVIVIAITIIAEFVSKKRK